MINGFKNITIGSYFPCDSVIHRMGAKFKFILILSLMLAASITQPNYSLFLIGFFSIVFGILSRIPFKVLIKCLKPFLFLFICTFLFHLFLTPGKAIPLFWGIIEISYEGLQQGITIDLRLILLIYFSSIITLTTPPKKMVNAIEWFLGPLKWFGFPVKNFSMMILISFKFIPILFQEINKISSFPKKKNLKKWKWKPNLLLKEAVSLISPVVINSFRRADELVIEIETHGFDVIDKL